MGCLLAVYGLSLACRIVGALLPPVNPTTDVWVSLAQQLSTSLLWRALPDLPTLLQTSECMWGMKNHTESLDIGNKRLPLYDVNAKGADIVCTLNVDSCLYVESSCSRRLSMGPLTPT